MGRRRGVKRPTASVDRPTDQREGAPAMKSGQRQIVTVLTALASMIVLNEGRQLTPLVCNSVNDLQAINEQTDFVFVTTRGKDCTFVFEGPPEAQLDIKVHSLSTEGAKNTCKNPPIRLFTYSNKNRLRQLEKVLCAEEDSVRTITDTNTAIISSTLRYGSFFVRVRPLSSLTTRILEDRTKPQNNFVRRSDLNSKRRNDLFRLTADFSDPTGIGGMLPPDLQSIDFFGTMNQFEIPLQFRAKPQGFVPSQYYQTSGGSLRPTDSYGAPVTSGPILWGPYTGRPGQQIDITTTVSPVEWVSSNQTQSGSTGSTAFTGYPDSNPTTETPTGSSKPTEALSTVEPTRYTEPLTSTSEPTTVPQTPSPTSVAPEKVTEEISSDSISSESNGSTVITNSTTYLETEVLSKEEAKQLRDGDNAGYLIVI
ncbi:hypothetical protein GE061_011418 [Apolygus lucorum]|uniref:CUB domain-containing protein n=1 Tax=Apolygus lucorum TaxID=248454 RepID=A0A8S9Y038_APOLU|nr:hypothetical protein GE061_011418 [Apolygus lucorum]